MKAFPIFFIFASTISHFIFGQSPSADKSNPMENSFAATVEIGSAIPKTDYKIDELAISGRMSLEYFFNISKSSAL